MRRRIIRTVALVLLLSVLVPSALAASAPTEKRGLVEYAETFGYRYGKLAQLMEPEVAHTYTLSSGINVVYGYENEVNFPSAAGRITCDGNDDYAILEISMTLQGSSSSSFERYFAYNLCCVSALEISQLDEQMDYVNNLIGESIVFHRQLEVWDIINENCTDKKMEARSSGKEVLVYSGNYDYYLKYYAKDDYETFWLIARAR